MVLFCFFALLITFAVIAVQPLCSLTLTHGVSSNNFTHFFRLDSFLDGTVRQRNIGTHYWSIMKILKIPERCGGARACEHRCACDMVVVYALHVHRLLQCKISV